MFLGSLNHNCRSKLTSNRLLTLCALAAVATGIGWATHENSGDPRNAKIDIPLSPKDVVGTEACAKCHAAEINVWKQTPHHDTFLTLHRKPQAQAIADKMGIASFKHDSACIKCHYSLQESAGTLEPIAGVSCESCTEPRRAGWNCITIMVDQASNATRNRPSIDMLAW